MSGWSLLIDTVAVLGAALLLGALMERLRQEAVAGYLIAGMVLGPGGLGWIANVEEVRGLAELGVALLLFAIGLEFSWGRLRRLGAGTAAAGTLQILLTGVGAVLACRVLGRPVGEAVILGASIPLSSTAVVLRILTRRAELDGPAGRTTLGILLLQDLAVVPLVLLVSTMGAGAPWAGSLAGLLRWAAGAATLLGAMFLVTRYVLPLLLLRSAPGSRDRDLPAVLALILGLGSAGAAHALQLSPILGAFLAGLFLAESPLAVQIRADVTPLRAGFLTLFFSSLGMAVRPPSEDALLLIGPLVIAVVAGKAAIGAGAALLSRQTLRTAVIAGLSLAQIGEFSFVLLEIGHRHGAVAPLTLEVLLATSVVTLFLTPYLISAAPGAAAVLSRTSRVRPAGEPAGEEQRTARVVVVGFGPAGQRVVETLQQAGLPFIVVDQNPRTVAQYSSSLPIQYGDATRAEILEHLRVPHARGVVVTLPDTLTAQLVVRQVKRMAPGVPILARARYHVHAPTLHEAGADQLVDEEDLVGVRLGAETLNL